MDAKIPYNKKFDRDEELNKLIDKINTALPEKARQKDKIEIMQRIVIKENSLT